MSESVRRNTASDAAVSISGDTLTQFLAQQCSVRSVTNDSQWATAIDGLSDAQLLALLRIYFKKIIKVG